MRSGASLEWVDITYVGFLFGHGGDALQMLELASGVRRRGGRARVIVPSTSQTAGFAERCDAAGVPCERTELISSAPDGARQSPVAMHRLWRSIESPLVHVHTGNSLLPRSLMVVLEATRDRRTLATLQSPFETIEPGSPRARLWARLANRRLGAVVSPSRHGTEFQLRCGLRPTVATTIPNSVDIARCAAGEGPAARAEIGVGDGEPLIVFTSRLAPQKRPVDGVRIFAAVASEFPSARMVIVGDGEETPAVVTAVRQLGLADRVTLLGYRTDVANWLAAATVWILPTERENFSVAVLEALAAGCTVLSTPCRGNDEILVDGVNSLTYGIGDVDAGAAALRRLLADSDLRSRLARQGTVDVQQYSADAMVDNYASLYAAMTTSASHQ